MTELGRAPGGIGWGPRERIAIDRALALSVPISEDAFPRPKPRLRLSRTIETEIIPRLMLAHRGEAAAAPTNTTEGRPDPAEIATLAGLAVSAAPDAASEHVHALLDSGRSLESILLDLMAPAARLLGDMWREDLCTFSEVTIGLSRLQAALHGLGACLGPSVPGVGCGHILLATAVGEQHSFGIAVLESLFRRDGWVVENGTVLTKRELERTVRDTWFDVLGVSLSCDVLLSGVKDFIRTLRTASLNPEIHVLVGGRFFMDHADLGAEVGADAVALDAADALRLARSVTGAGLAHHVGRA